MKLKIVKGEAWNRYIVKLNDNAVYFIDKSVIPFCNKYFLKDANVGNTLAEYSKTGLFNKRIDIKTKDSQYHALAIKSTFEILLNSNTSTKYIISSKKGHGSISTNTSTLASWKVVKPKTYVPEAYIELSIPNDDCDHILLIGLVCTTSINHVYNTSNSNLED